MNGPEWVRELPGPFLYRFLGIALWQWIGLLVLFAAGYLAYGIGRLVARVVIRVRLRILTTPISPATDRAIRRAMGVLFATLAASAILDELYLVGRPQTITQKLFGTLMIVAIMLLAYAVWDSICDDLAAHLTGYRRAEGLLVPLARKALRVCIVVVGLMFAATELFGLDVRSLLASLGIGGLVIALAGKDSVENVFGSFTILFDMPFAIGDWVRIPPTEGIVEEINMRSTRIRTFEDTLITLPNANLIRASVENVSARRSRRQQISLRLAYDVQADNLKALCEDLRHWLDERTWVVKGKTIVQVSDFSETSVGLLVQCQFKAKAQADELAHRHALAMYILELRDKHKVRFVADPVAAVGAQPPASTPPNPPAPRPS